MKDFLDLSKVIKRRFASGVWVPLRLWETKKQGEYNQPGFIDQFDGAHSILFPLDKREWGEQFSWQDDHEATPWPDENFYKPCDVYCHSAEIDVGFRLVLRQPITGEQHDVWHLHQDIVIALRLLREGDVWVRPEEDYAEVVRLRKGDDGRPVAMEMRAEFLRDYLCARNAALRIATYRERSVVVETLEGLDHEEAIVQSDVEDGRLEKIAVAINRQGGPIGSKVAVFHAGRTDVDADEDVPIVGPADDSSVSSASWSYEPGGPTRYRVGTEFRRDEWIEPAKASLRVRRDRVPSEMTFIVEADGQRMTADDLYSEDIGRWLWFSPELIANLAKRRGASLQWYTRQTGGISTPSDSSVHFGINPIGLVTVYASDVARLPEWERRFWAGHNVSPEGGVCPELLAAQMEARPARTKAPERYFMKMIGEVNRAWQEHFEVPLFRAHAEAVEIGRRVHRFRSLDRPGLFALAKDVARLTADSIDVAAAQKIAPPPKGEKRGGLKSLELALSTLCSPALAHKLMGPLFAAYELRLADAHLPRSDQTKFFQLLDIDEGNPPITMGRDLLIAVVSSLAAIVHVLDQRHVEQKAYDVDTGS
ncbi:hypothetical protein [Novosphingobium sp. KACC 22771]|uniref:hypothetical protein n=1 Tax=Novosphingobium sp. KACC 22771 TaxID=3025670 RepID=UPI002365A5C7|nr:hypothetical protein [Novosphingobium sp. KACC 22771]WDF72277.1 hypothetical protein PQ467_16030 [Novosphingobium sp. KACC 22771]